MTHKPGYSSSYIPASRGDDAPIGNFPPAMGIVTDIAPGDVRKAMRTTAHFATAHIDPNRALTPDEAADVRRMLEALGFIDYPTNRVGAKHK